MGQKFLMDTNIIIDYTADKLDNEASDFVENIFNTDFTISVIAKIEVLSYNEVQQKMQLLEEFLQTATVLPLNEAITQQTIMLKRQHKMKLGDAVIAATALVYNHTLITRDFNDFKNIKGLTLINPWQL